VRAVETIVGGEEWKEKIYEDKEWIFFKRSLLL
jgi:hypothetical protein